MTPDYDLPDLQTWQADLWIRLQVGALHAEIFADQAERLGFPLALGDCPVAALTNKPQAILNSA